MGTYRTAGTAEAWKVTQSARQPIMTGPAAVLPAATCMAISAKHAPRATIV